MPNYLLIDDMIKRALQEDVPEEDITTNSVVAEDSLSEVDLIAKEEGLIAGLFVFERVFQILGDVTVQFFVQDGENVQKGTLVGLIRGNTRKILVGERTALNYLQKMSGVATLTAQFVEKLQGTNAKLLDTRKTTPNMRLLEKYAVKIGGGHNHRSNLSDGVLLKDNHIAAAGGVKKAVEAARKNVSFVRKIEVEVETLEMVTEALEAKADIIMLDNMDLSTVREAVEMIGDKALIECSGNVTLDSIGEIAKTGVHYISSGALTHSYKILDLSMKNLRSI